MEEKTTQKSVSENSTYEIPSEIYHVFLMFASEENKGKIIDLLKNHNHLKSQEEFIEIEVQLIGACKSEDFDLIKIFLQEPIKNDSKDLFFKIDKTNKTASLYNVNQDLEDIIIPRVVKHENIDYLITSVCGLCPFSFAPNTNSKKKNLKFVEDSAVRTIYGNSLSNSNIEGIYFPKSLIDLREEWCYNTKDLTNITISPFNGQFMFKDDKYLVGKSDPNNDEFDVLLYVKRQIEEISLPSNIKIIESCSFQLSNINQITIPASVTKICQSAFNFCKNLTFVKIPTNSNLQIIQKSAFCNSSIKKIYIPASVTQICEDAFGNCTNLTKIEIPTNSNLQTIEKQTFSKTSIKEIYIPENVTKICKSAFSVCNCLNKVEIPTNSKLQTIEYAAFANSDIRGIYIPESVSELCERAFMCCFQLQIVEFSENSKLQSIPKSAFENCSKLIIMIPASLKKLINANNST